MKNLITLDSMLTTSAYTTSRCIVEDLRNGATDPMRVAVFLKKIAKVAKNVFENVDAREVIDKEALKYVGGEIGDIYGAQVEHTVITTKYDFQSSMHPEYLALCDAERIIKARKKEIEAELKELTDSKEIVISREVHLQFRASGEIVTIHPPEVQRTRGAKFRV